MTAPATPPPGHQPPPVQFELDTYPFTILRAGERLAECDPDTIGRLQLEHVAYIQNLVAAGHVLAAGAFSNHSYLTGMGFWTPGTSVEEIRRLMDGDPAVKAGVEECEILTFLCPKGALVFPGRGGET